MPHENLLIVADSERDANMLFAAGMFVPDPFVYLRLKGRCFVVLSDPEMDRARKRAKHCRVLALNSYLQKLKNSGTKSPSHARVIAHILQEHCVKKVTVPGSFPYGIARELRELRVKLKVKKNPFFPERERKTTKDVKKISAALTMAEVGLSEGIHALKNSKIGKSGRLMYHNVPLTSEKLRSIIDTAILQVGGWANRTVVAGGAQTCDPCEAGYGPLRANQPIIINVFPRSQKTGYYGDITRTVVKGRANEAVRSIYQTVARGQEIAFGLVYDGASGADIHDGVQTFFKESGYKTGKRNGCLEGFFHGTGHGLGLELRETPCMGAACKDTLRAGNVVTVEPGLYYPGIGGVRLEDVALVTAKAPRNLTKFEKVLEV